MYHTYNRSSHLFLEQENLVLQTSSVFSVSPTCSQPRRGAKRNVFSLQTTSSSFPLFLICSSRSPFSPSSPRWSSLQRPRPSPITPSSSSTMAASFLRELSCSLSLLAFLTDRPTQLTRSPFLLLLDISPKACVRSRISFVPEERYRGRRSRCEFELDGFRSFPPIYTLSASLSSSLFRSSSLSLSFSSTPAQERIPSQ